MPHKSKYIRKVKPHKRQNSCCYSKSNAQKGEKITKFAIFIALIFLIALPVYSQGDIDSVPLYSPYGRITVDDYIYERIDGIWTIVDSTYFLKNPPSSKNDYTILCFTIPLMTFMLIIIISLIRKKIT